MKRNTYSDELKEQVVHECQQMGNVSLVARRHGISKPTVYSWVRKYKENGSIRALSKNKKENTMKSKNELIN